MTSFSGCAVHGQALPDFSDGVHMPICDGFAVVVLAAPMKLYTLSTPPTHRGGVVCLSRADALANKEYLDDKTTE